MWTIPRYRLGRSSAFRADTGAQDYLTTYPCHTPALTKFFEGFAAV